MLEISVSGLSTLIMYWLTVGIFSLYQFTFLLTTWILASENCRFLCQQCYWINRG